MKKAAGSPPYTAAPRILRDRLDALDMNASDFAMRMGRSKKVISETLNGLTSISATFALHCERVLRIDMSTLTVAQMHEELERARKTTNLDHIPPFWTNRYRRVQRGPKPKARS